MEKLCRQYMNHVKATFPIIGKNELKYLDQVEADLINYYSENAPDSVESIYKDFGTPTDILYNYYDSTDVDPLIKRIYRIRLKKHIAICLVILLAVISGTFLIESYLAYQALEHERNHIEYRIDPPDDVYSDN